MLRKGQASRGTIFPLHVMIKGKKKAYIKEVVVLSTYFQ